MKAYMGKILLLAGICTATGAVAQAPAGATGQCKDQSYTTAAKKWQACSGHQGVQTWYAETKATVPQAPAAVSPIFADNGHEGFGKSHRAWRRCRSSLGQYGNERVSLPGRHLLWKDEGR